MARIKKEKKGAVPSVTPAASSAPFAERHAAALICVGLALLCFAVYGQILSHDFLKCDDDICVTDNPHVYTGLSWSNLVWACTKDISTYLIPVMWLSHMTDCQVYGLHPWGHHLTSLILHAANAVLLFLVFARMTGRMWPSALLAALFAVHPLNTETVSWIAERKGVLSAFFWIAALGAYAWHTRRRGAARYAFVVLFFLLGLMSKPSVLAFPCVLLLLDYWPFRRLDPVGGLRALFRSAARPAIEKTPLFLVTLLFCGITVYLTATRSSNFQLGAKVPFLDRCANTLVVYVIYLRQTLWPSGLAIYYPHPITRPLWQVAGAALLLAVITLFCLWNARKRPYLPVGWLWYLGTLVPVIGIVQNGDWAHADRYAYIPLVGVFIMVAWGLADLVAAHRLSARIAVLLSLSAIAALAVCAGLQARYWRDNDTLFRHAIDSGNESAMAWDNIGRAAMERGDYAEARAGLERAVKLDPDNTSAEHNLGLLSLRQKRYDEARTCLARVLQRAPGHAKALTNLGLVALEQGRYDEAGTLFTRALGVSPNDAKVLNNLGLLSLRQGRYDEAKSWLAKALDAAPDSAEALNNMGKLCLDLQRYDEAQNWFEKALVADPKYVIALDNMGLLALDRKRYEEARKWLTKALEVEPKNAEALVNLGSVAMDQGRDDEAASCLKRALAVEPNNVSALYNLSVIEMDAGRFNDALALLDRVLQANPRHAKANNNAGWCLMSLGQFDKAVPYLRVAVALDPHFAKAMFNLADALERLGQREEAGAYRAKAAALAPDRPGS